MGKESVDMANSKNQIFDELISNVKKIEKKIEELELADVENYVGVSKSNDNNKLVSNIEKIESKLKELIELENKKEEDYIKNKLLEFTSELKLADLDKEINTNVEKIESKLKELIDLDEKEEEEDIKSRLLEYTSELKLAHLDKEINTK